MDCITSARMQPCSSESSPSLKKKLSNIYIKSSLRNANRNQCKWRTLLKTLNCNISFTSTNEMLFSSLNLSVIMPDYIFRFVSLFCSPVGLSVLQIGLSKKQLTFPSCGHSSHLIVSGWNISCMTKMYMALLSNANLLDLLEHSPRHNSVFVLCF